MSAQSRQTRTVGGSSPRGFTLIELMIVVAIIGILASIAIPNFTRFQAKSKQSEAKMGLKAIFTGAKSLFAEKDTYGSTFSDIHFDPETNRRYTYAYGSSVLVADRNSSITTCSGAAVTTSTLSMFTATACGNVDTDTLQDEWFINSDNTLSNRQNDVVN